MGWYLPSFEKLRCPPAYQAHITAIGGKNRFGEPNFRIVWGQTPTELIYGVDAFGRKGQHTVFVHQGIAAWFVEAWKPPECFGSPEMWYTMSYDAESGQHTLGDFPWHGKYMPVSFNLFVRKVIPGKPRFDKETGTTEIVGERMEIDAMPLNHWILDLVIPNLIKELELTEAQKKVARENLRQLELADSRRQAMDAYLDAAPAFDGKAGTYESNREAWMQRIKEKQAGMKLTAEDIRLGRTHKQLKRKVN